MNKERRKHPRAFVRCSITLWKESAQQRLNAYTKNIGKDGVCVILDEELSIHQEVRLQVDLDDALPPIVCHSRVIWTLAYKMGDYPIQSPTRYETGFSFIDLAETDRVRIVKIVTQRA